MHFSHLPEEHEYYKLNVGFHESYQQKTDVQVFLKHFVNWRVGFSWYCENSEDHIQEKNIKIVLYEQFSCVWNEESGLSFYFQEFLIGVWFFYMSPTFPEFSILFIHTSKNIFDEYWQKFIPIDPSNELQVFSMTFILSFMILIKPELFHKIWQYNFHHELAVWETHENSYRIKFFSNRACSTILIDLGIMTNSAMCLIEALCTVLNTIYSFWIHNWEIFWWDTVLI